MQLFRNLFVAALCTFGLAAQAQWQWVDNAGRKVFSDQAPPPDIPLKNIVKQPGKSAATSVEAPSTPASAATPQLSNDDKELLAKKKKTDSEAMARIKEEADSLSKIKATNCEKAKANQALLDSGVRMAVTNAKGEREFLDDAARAAEQRRIRTVMETNCK
ncbi:MAG: DUF4124 domain-containing protein [Zoogloea sp.]|nr:DUF4124 domain-containing protein [Zoogloea sp.]